MSTRMRRVLQTVGQMARPIEPGLLLEMLRLWIPRLEMEFALSLAECFAQVLLEPVVLMAWCWGQQWGSCSCRHSERLQVEAEVEIEVEVEAKVEVKVKA